MYITQLRICKKAYPTLLSRSTVMLHCFVYYLFVSSSWFLYLYLLNRIQLSTVIHLCFICHHLDSFVSNSHMFLYPDVLLFTIVFFRLLMFRNLTSFLWIRLSNLTLLWCSFVLFVIVSDPLRSFVCIFVCINSLILFCSVYCFRSSFKSLCIQRWCSCFVYSFQFSPRNLCINPASPLYRL